MKVKVTFNFEGNTSVSHETEATDAVEVISSIQKNKYYKFSEDGSYYVVDTDKAAYFCVTELGK
ncbi:hypothetical protein D0469_17250 [Peribacillus saganii]|uniref:Uncharacterized protein n=1 Tax=Peribacillus saganii TaxID=2303992 RepID=A0A372LJ48_9BACI|nr:hypothetical protein [Peribacillus saganii]RFU66380.1 hypothetical protein D0469_17250 [Peribacillus saganii]